jgi:hypothetical protein
MSFDIETKKNIDIEFFLNEIDNYDNKEHIISMFKKGPPKNKGFMWCESNGGPYCHWTEKEAKGLKYVGNLVLDKGWDSSGYGFMMRFIQQKIRENYPIQHQVLNPEEDDQNLQNSLPVAIAIPIVTTSVSSIVPQVEPPGTYLRHGPWYESQGPCASQVRQDVFKYITNNFYNEEELTPQRNIIIRKVILQIIPDTRNDFGSYRGYATFNVPKNLSFKVIKEIEIQDKAISTLNKKFLPILQHYLYKPNGRRAKQVANTTLVGKIDL